MQGFEKNDDPTVKHSSPKTSRTLAGVYVGIAFVLLFAVVALQQSPSQASTRARSLHSSLTTGQEYNASTPNSLACDPVFNPHNVDSCSASFEGCQTDRFSHSMPLCAGQSLCNHQWRLEVTTEGSFQWKDCGTNETQVFYSSDTAMGSHFELSEAGVLQVFNANNTILWELESDQEISPWPNCKRNPHHNCPYIHLRDRGGAMVLNWISGGRWQAKDFKHIYDDLLEN